MVEVMVMVMVEVWVMVMVEVMVGVEVEVGVMVDGEVVVRVVSCLELNITPRLQQKLHFGLNVKRELSHGCDRN